VQLQARQQQQPAFLKARDRQICLRCGHGSNSLQAQRDAGARNAQQQQILAQQQLLAQQNLIAQAQLAQRQNNLEQRVALLESANGIRRDDKVVQDLLKPKRRSLWSVRKRLQAEQALVASEAKRKQEAEMVRVKEKLALEQQKRQEAKEASKSRSSQGVGGIQPVLGHRSKSDVAQNTPRQ